MEILCDLPMSITASVESGPTVGFPSGGFVGVRFGFPVRRQILSMCMCKYSLTCPGQWVGDSHWLAVTHRVYRKRAKIPLGTTESLL